MGIVSIGKSLEKVCNIRPSDSFFDFFNIKRPEISITKFTDLSHLKNQLVIIEKKNNSKVFLRGQFEFLESEKCYLFVGTPWFESMDQVHQYGLTLHDFTLHDPMIDLLHVLKTQEITTEEIKQLYITVNEQKDKLKRSESNYRTIIEKATDIIYKINFEGYFTFVNEIAERITGYTKAELLTMRYSQLIRNDYKKQAFAIYRDQIVNKTPTSYFEFPLVTKQGKEIWMGQSVQYPQGDTAKPELTALAIDINKRKQAEQNLKLQEEKYRNIIANMNLGLLEVDNDENIQFANQSFCNMSGYTLQELAGKKASMILLEGDVKEMVADKNEKRKGGIADMYSVRVKNKSGEEKWWIISGAPRYNDEGILVGSVGIHLDITEQKLLEQELKIAKLKAEDSSKTKEVFLATMSHEIRTPLNAIIGMTDLMRTNIKSRNKENLDILNFSAKNLLALITDILDLSKIDSGKIEIGKNHINLKILLNGVFQTFKPICEERDVELILNVDVSVPESINGDELRLSQILNNLLSNAIKFTPKGYVKLNVNAEHLTDNKMRFYFKITDTGIGIRKNKLSSIFNDFEQADAAIERQFGGTGLGLGITKKLIELHGGEIKVESKINKGSSFSFFIDYEMSAEKKKRNQQKKIITKAEQFSIKDKTVLLVEDNLANQKVALSYLGQWGLKCDIANNGKEAMEILQNNKYDLALVDLFMPVMDGFETIKQIRKNKAIKSLPIIALTASAEINLMDRAIALGADKCLTKPFNAQQLHYTILGLLNIEELKKEGIVKELTPLKTAEKFRVINLKKIEEASLGSKSFVLDMFDILGKEIPELFKEATTCLLKSEYMLFSKVIHKMKNNLLMLGMESIREDLQFIEEHSKKGERMAEVKTAFERLNKIWIKAKAELHKAKKLAVLENK